MWKRAWEMVGAGLVGRSRNSDDGSESERGEMARAFGRRLQRKAAFVLFVNHSGCVMVPREQSDRGGGVPGGRRLGVRYSDSEI